MGKSFDHTMHHAITTIEKNDCEDNTIVEEVKKGYIIKEKVFIVSFSAINDFIAALVGVYNAVQVKWLVGFSVSFIILLFG